MKLIPIRELIQGRNILFCEDSIVRGTQLRENVRVLLEEYDLKGFHMRAACPPLIHGCKFLNFSRSRSERDLVGRRAIEDLEGNDNPDLEKYADEESKAHKKMVRWIKEDLGLTSLKYQKLDDLVQAIGLPKEKLCTFCWDGCEGCGKK
jgi:amidophosphoribosyltransferase